MSERASVRNTAGGPIDTVLQAGAIHGDVTLSAGAWRPPVPRQVPPAPRRFTNRSTELAHLARHRHQARVVLLMGLGGVGKSALAAAFPHQVSADFPDGHLHLSLAGAGPHPATPGAHRFRETAT